MEFFSWFVVMTRNSHFTVCYSGFHGVCDVKRTMCVPQMYQAASLDVSAGTCRVVHRTQWWEVVLGLS